MYAIRRDLRRGKTNGFFQVKVAETIKKLGDVVEYIDGQKYDIVMTNCYLHNHIATSEKIHSGRYPKKRPCAWIVCDSYDIVPKGIDQPKKNEISFNPRVTPNYICDGQIVDGQKYSKLIQSNNKIYK